MVTSDRDEIGGKINPIRQMNLLSHTVSTESIKYWEHFYLLQAKISKFPMTRTELRHPDHTLITYPNLGHLFFPSSQWVTTAWGTH